MARQPYAWLCDGCRHLVTSHLMTGDDLYVCEDCVHAMRQGDPETGLDREQFERWERQRAADVPWGRIAQDE